MSAAKDGEARVRDLEAIQEIMNLEADYCYAADAQDPDAYARVFAQDGVLDVGPFGGRIAGKEAIREFCRTAFPATVGFMMHCLHNPRITVSGDKAKARFYWQAAVTWKATNEAVWQAGSYDDEFVRTNEGWKIKEKGISFFYATPYDKGWVKQQFLGT